MKETKKFCPELLQKLPPEIDQLWQIFGDNIRLVGGCVRDLLLQRPIADFDFASSLPPSKAQEILTKNYIKSLPTGLKYGTITALINDQAFQITTLRQDKDQKGRDCEVDFLEGSKANFAADAARRDFTINALYLCRQGFVYDYFSGFLDLENKEVKFIGLAKQRISEDYLRILRFFRFSCNYSDKFNNEALQSCIELKAFLKQLSKERIRGELLKILSSQEKQRVIEILKIVESEKIASEIFSFELDFSALELVFKFADNNSLQVDQILKLAAIIGDLREEKKSKKSEEITEQKKDSILKAEQDLTKIGFELCATNFEKRFIKKLQKTSKDFLKNHHEIFSKRNSFDFRKIKELLIIENKRLAAIDGQKFTINWLIYFLSKNREKFEGVSEEQIFEIFTILKNLKIPNFPINGNDLIELGIAKEKISKTLLEMRKNWADSEFLASKHQLLAPYS